MSIPILPVLLHYGFAVPDLPASAGYRPMRCPEHDDRMASAQVSPRYGRWNCFVCDLNEDAIALIMRKEGIGYRPAVERAETITGSGGRAVRGQPGRRRQILDSTGADQGNLDLFSARRRRR